MTWTTTGGYASFMLEDSVCPVILLHNEINVFNSEQPIGGEKKKFEQHQQKEVTLGVMVRFTCGWKHHFVLFSCSLETNDLQIYLNGSSLLTQLSLISLMHICTI